MILVFLGLNNLSITFKSSKDKSFLFKDLFNYLKIKVTVGEKESSIIYWLTLQMATEA